MFSSYYVPGSILNALHVLTRFSLTITVGEMLLLRLFTQRIVTEGPNPPDTLLAMEMQWATKQIESPPSWRFHSGAIPGSRQNK